MEIRITVTGPRRLRLPRRRSARLGIGLVAALVLAVPVAWATDRFADVPAASPHHNDVNTIAAAGITGGCNPPANTLYCPDAAVRRDQMASFLARGLGRIAVSQTALAATVPRSAGESWVDVAEVVLDVGGTGAGTQYVKVDASLNVYGATECECRFRLRLQDVSTGQSAFGGTWQTTPASTSDHGTNHIAIGVFDASPGARAYRLQMWYVSSVGGADPQTLSVDQPYLVATTYPFLRGSSTVDAVAAPARK